MAGSDVARGGASVVGNIGLCASVLGTELWKLCKGISVVADKGGGGGGAARVGLGGDGGDTIDGGGETTEEGGDGSKATTGATALDAGYVAWCPLADFESIFVGGGAGVVTGTSGACTSAGRGLFVPDLPEPRFDWRNSEFDCRFSLKAVGSALVGTGGSAVFGGGKSEVELASNGVDEQEWMVDRSLVVAEVDVRLDERRSVGTGGNGHVGGGAGGGCEGSLEIGNGGSGTFGGAVAGGRSEVCFDELALSGKGGRGTFGGGCGDRECSDGLTGDTPLAYSRDE